MELIVTPSVSKPLSENVEQKEQHWGGTPEKSYEAT